MDAEIVLHARALAAEAFDMRDEPARTVDAPRAEDASSKLRSETIPVLVSAIRFAAEGIHLYEFSSLDGRPLPDAAAGAHIDVLLGNGLTRQYSLTEARQGATAYVIAVKRDPDSRGGSTYIHDTLRVGQTLRISAPRNHFALKEDAPHTVLIAGGIGITPIHAMVRRLEALGRSYELHYACRKRAEAAFAQELRASNITLHIDEEADSLLDLQAIVANAPDASHFYCCGPTPMLEAFERATASAPPANVHVEYFSAKHEIAAEGGFEVELSRSGKRVAIPKGKTILDVLRDMGLDAPSACEQGLCGACETRVLAGQPDHRDSILSDEERAANETMMICCSGSKSPLLVLDL